MEKAKTLDIFDLEGGSLEKSNRFSYIEYEIDDAENNLPDSQVSTTSFVTQISSNKNNYSYSTSTPMSLEKLNNSEDINILKRKNTNETTCTTPFKKGKTFSTSNTNETTCADSESTHKDLKRLITWSFIQQKLRKLTYQ
uniref:Uncharacterized protein n=1 Tax=Strongyloides venezuelensis TaxID=75913 RepID=A0A0K0F292_STRVS